MGWVVVLVHDGPITMQVFGDDKGNPFPSRESAERAMAGVNRPGNRYTAYVVPVDKAGY